MGQNARNLGHVPLPRSREKRSFICLEQLLALLCILGLAGRVRLKDAGLAQAEE